MIILDTNIVSVIYAPNHPDLPIIEAWKQNCPDHDVRVSSISRAEISYGIAILPEGSKKRLLADAADRFFAPLLELILPFGVREAEVYGAIVACRRAKGRPIGILDAQIAAIAKVAGAVVATRDVSGFLDCGVPVINPYQQV